MAAGNSVLYYMWSGKTGGRNLLGMGLTGGATVGGVTCGPDLATWRATEAMNLAEICDIFASVPRFQIRLGRNLNTDSKMGLIPNQVGSRFYTV